jgi:hypothetical protein
MGKNKWFDPRGSDTDSRIVTDEDDRLSREGWNPNTREYWDELTNRLKKRLPHKFSGGTISPRNSPRAPVGGSGREAGNTGGQRQTVKISPERVAAMKEIGAWDDPKARAEMIKEYQKYDKEQTNAHKA